MSFPIVSSLMVRWDSLSDSLSSFSRVVSCHNFWDVIMGHKVTEEFSRTEIVRGTSSDDTHVTPCTASRLDAIKRDHQTKATASEDSPEALVGGE